MIEFTTGNLLEADAEALVNTVNTVGVMGKGVALQFKLAFPANFKAYLSAVRRGEVQLGRMHVFPTGNFENPRYIVNFPTKGHWRQRSSISDIEAGLDELRRFILDNNIRSVAVPPLGCGNGGLSWGDVRPLIESKLSSLDGTRVLVFEPGSAPDAESMPVGSEKPKMTPARAALLGILARYLTPGYRLALLEVQKLCYFLQEAGEPLKLTFGKARYGPYAPELEHALQRQEGHYIRGYGDRSEVAQIRVIAEALSEVEEELARHTHTRERFERVTNLVEGFESPYGLELLATVHWVANHDPEARESLTKTIEQVQEWSARKKGLFSAEHIKIARDQLQSQGWLGSSSLSAT